MACTTRWTPSLALAVAALCACGEPIADRPDVGATPRDVGSTAPDAASADDASAEPVDVGLAPGLDASTVPPDAAVPCVETCPVASGIPWECKRRFVLGTNWAWHNFGADFGGVAAWGQLGVSKDPDTFDADLAAMAAKGVNVIRWWMFPGFFSESVTFGADGAPSGIGGTLKDDVQKALELAEKNDVYLMLTLFSFDSFGPTRDEYGIHITGLAPIVKDAAKSSKLYANLVGPVADAVESSPHRRRMIAWDLVNEPEWAMTGPSLYGDPAFEPNGKVEAVTHAQMETFLAGVTATLRQHSSAKVTLGSAAIKWAKAWTHLDLDFYQLHYYDWVYEWFPYTAVTPANSGMAGKPVLMGEFPNAGLSAIASKGYPARTAAQFAGDLWNLNYAGALTWAYNDDAFPWSSFDLLTFGNLHSCETQF